MICVTSPFYWLIPYLSTLYTFFELFSTYLTWFTLILIWCSFANTIKCVTFTSFVMLCVNTEDTFPMDVGKFAVSFLSCLILATCSILSFFFLYLYFLLLPWVLLVALFLLLFPPFLFFLQYCSSLGSLHSHHTNCSLLF